MAISKRSQVEHVKGGKEVVQFCCNLPWIGEKLTDKSKLIPCLHFTPGLISSRPRLCTATLASQYLKVLETPYLDGSPKGSVVWLAKEHGALQRGVVTLDWILGNHFILD